MTGFLSKLRAITLGSAHDLLDAAVDYSSPTALRQYVRDLEDATGKMSSEQAVQNGQLRTMQREKIDLDQRIATLLETIKGIKDKQPDLARSKASQVLLAQKHSAQMATDMENQKQVTEQLKTAVDRLVAKHDEMLARVHELERLDRDSKTKESAAHAIDSAGSVLGTVGTQSVDDLEDRMRRRNDVASAKFDQSMSGMPAPEEANKEDVDALLNSL